MFYCMWMSDKPRNQQQLARDLAGLIDVLPQEVVIPFLDAFWKTMAREWNGIGQLRYTTIRCGSEGRANYGIIEWTNTSTSFDNISMHLFDTVQERIGKTQR